MCAGIPFAHWWVLKISRACFTVPYAAINSAPFSGCCASIIWSLGTVGGRKGRNRTLVKNWSWWVLANTHSVVSTTGGAGGVAVWGLLLRVRGERRRGARRAAVVSALCFRVWKPFYPTRHCSWFPAMALAQVQPWLKFALPSRPASLVESFVCRFGRAEGG